MPIVVTCPSCSSTLKAPDAAAGKKVKCPKCTSTIMVPAAAPPPPVEDIVEEFVDEPQAAEAPYERAPRRPQQDEAPIPPPGQISRQTVGLVAVLGAGTFGIHKFILGKKTAGIVMLLVAAVGSICVGLGPVAMLIIALIEGIKYLRMSDAEFYDTYVAGDKAWL